MENRVVTINNYLVAASLTLIGWGMLAEVGREGQGVGLPALSGYGAGALPLPLCGKG